MRNGFNGLASKVQNALKDNPFSGQVFILRGRRGDVIKVLLADADGLCLFIKRLERRRFVWLVNRLHGERGALAYQAAMRRSNWNSSAVPLGLSKCSGQNVPAAGVTASFRPPCRQDPLSTATLVPVCWYASSRRSTRNTHLTTGRQKYPPTGRRSEPCHSGALVWCGERATWCRSGGMAALSRTGQLIGFVICCH